MSIFRPWEEMVEGLPLYHGPKDRSVRKQRCLTSVKSLQEAAWILHDMGPKELVVIESAGVTVFADGKFYNAPFNPKKLAGRTGRGDTCFFILYCETFRNYGRRQLPADGLE